MTLATGTRSRSQRAGAFTLVELILVMALLVIAVSLVMPTMSKFFGVRAQDAEVKRIMALIHYGQVRAVGEGLPMVLWIDSTHGKYGLRQDYVFGDDPRGVENDLAKGLSIDVSKNNTRAAIANSATGRVRTGQVSRRQNLLPAIYFQPDGTVNSALSVTGVMVKDVNSEPVWIVPSDSEQGYELQTQNPNSRRR